MSATPVHPPEPCAERFCKGLCRCIASLYPDRQTVVRRITLAGAASLVVGAMFSMVVAGNFSENIEDCVREACEYLRDVAAEKTLGAMLLHVFLSGVAALVIAAECQLSCVGRYFGFLAFRSGRGVSLLVGGLVMVSYSRVLVHSFESSGHAPSNSSGINTATGAVSIACGAINLLCSLVPSCCTCLALPADPLTIQFRETHAHCHATQTPRKRGGGVAEVSHCGVDPELGEQAGEQCKSPRAGSSSVTKGRKPAKGPCKTAPTGAASANPFVRGAAGDGDAVASSLARGVALQQGGHY